MAKRIHLSASQEDYIEAISLIIDEKKVVRGKEIARRLKVSGASVTEALRALARKGLINYAPYEVITLTDAGRQAAADVIRRHNALKDFFIRVLCVDPEIAEDGACRVEHAAPPEIIDRMVRFVRFIETCPRGGSELVKGFTDSCGPMTGGAGGDCRECLAKSLRQVEEG